MLSVERCRQLLSNDGGQLSDAKIEQLRLDLYVIAEIAIGVWQRRSRSRGTVLKAAAHEGTRGKKQGGAAREK